MLILGGGVVDLTPMMCARLLHAEPLGYRPGALFRWSERFYDGMSAGYMDWVIAVTVSRRSRSPY